MLGEIRNEMKESIEMHIQMGQTPQSLETNASAQVVREVWGTELLPHINIIYFAPATNAP